jgi:serine kinase of HPr protein (carbohydrate metabolism regulator)
VELQLDSGLRRNDGRLSERELVHGTCVALGRCAALLRGASGSGKSDLALRFLALPAEREGTLALVADDQAFVMRAPNGALLASPPDTIAGKMEVRGIGIVEMKAISDAELVLVCDLVGPEDVPRMPLETPERTMIAGVLVPKIRLYPFEPSAPLKLKLALLRACTHHPN